MDSKLIVDATLAATAVAVASMLINLIVVTASRRQKRTWNETSKRFDDEITGLSRDLDTVSRQAGEHVRRIAWLESRARYSQTQTKQSDNTPQPRVTITERRHRVLSLAKRGQDIDTIARTLGMNHGEVELMINLGRAA